MFDENPLLLTKLEKLQKTIIQKIFEIIDMPGTEIRVSLLVYANFKVLAGTPVATGWRALEILREARSSFNPEHN